MLDGDPLEETNGGLMQTNSMIIPKSAMNTLKREKKLESTLNSESLISAGIMTANTPSYIMGDPIDYPKVMTQSEDLIVGGNAVISFGYGSLQGRPAPGAPQSKPNQDSLTVFNHIGSRAVFGIFDGHGPYGEYAAHFIRDNLHHQLEEVYKELGDEANPNDAIRIAMLNIHEAFIAINPSKPGDVDPDVSGAVVVIAMVENNNLYVANVGDSRCILGSQGTNDRAFKVHVMSDDHKPENVTEQERVLLSSAVLLSESELRGGKKKDGKTYVCRRNDKGQIVYGVMFTRSIGDKDAHVNLGVSADTEVKQRCLQEDKVEYLVLASDGVWDQMSNEEVLNVVFKHKDPLKSANKIIELARNRWDTDKLHTRRDDISVIVARLLCNE